MDRECYLTDPRREQQRSRHRIFRRVALATGLVALVAGLWLETRESYVQAHWFAAQARNAGWEMQAGANAGLWLPQSGPYDIRLGYSQMKDMLPRLSAAGYAVTTQARQSEKFGRITSRGYYPIYHEKSQAGLSLLDHRGTPLYLRRYPQRQYDSFAAIPPVLVAALLYVENRDLLDPESPRRNPAVDWGRLTRAAMSQTLRALEIDDNRAGGSTLATQIEKFRHSPGGRTHNADDKWRQMISASLRAYQGGEETLAARQTIVLNFLNSVPLAGLAGHGEVIGLGDGLWAWYGRDFASVNRLLADPAADPAARAQAFKEAMSLIVAQRRPSSLLLDSKERLEQLTDSYLRLLRREADIPASLLDDALRLKLVRSGPARDGEAISFIERKAVNNVRGALSDLLGIADPYALDRFDLAVRSTLDATAQSRVTTLLGQLGKPEYLACAGFREHRLLNRGNPAEVTYSVTLYEKTPLGNLLRVQADNLNQPLDINAGTKLDLGSSAKLRTLVSYLSVIADLHQRYAGLDDKALDAVQTMPADRLSNWAIAYLRGRQTRDLGAMLQAAMEKRYSANPGETFFTGGGIHRFSNFRHEDDAMLPSVGEALEQSVNLAFVRIMRDVVHYHAYEAVDAPARGLRDGDEAARADLLERFGEREGISFLNTFWQKYRDVAPQDRLDILADSVAARPGPLAAVFLGTQPASDFAAFQAFMRQRLGDKAGTDSALQRLFSNHATRQYTLSDLGYLAGLHPLEVWLVRHLQTHPAAGLTDIIAASAAERREASRWLQASRFHQARQLRIAIILEVMAFERLAEEWRRLGYPFEHLVPSLATAIGSSADRPAALAELMGIIVNDGLRRPVVRIDQLRFAAATPFETVLDRQNAVGERVLPAELTQVLRRALLRVVENGTAKRVRNVYRDADGQPLAVGGKTGTGDHRFQVMGTGGTLKSSRVMNRAATVVFYIGENFYGVVTAFVPGSKAAAYDFTSALPVQLLKQLQPALEPLITGRDGAPQQCLDGPLAKAQ